MLENNRDEINFHKFLKSVRTSQDVTLEQVGDGICSKSEMSRVEAGNRLPDKLVRDRLTARLGISGEEYEEYLLPREYVQWELRMEILRSINKKDISGAEEKVSEYEAKYDSNNVERQFVCAMKFMICEMKGCSEDVLRELITETLECTIEDIDAALDGAHLLADQELNIILEYVRLKEDVVSDISATEWRLREYDKVVKYVQDSCMDKLSQAKVYSKAACFISELLLTEHMTEESLRYALKLCTSAIELLRDTVRLYYFVELNEYRVNLIEKLRTYLTDDEEISEMDNLYLTSKEWAKLFHELYTENELPVYMENFTYLYTETECNNVVDVIRKRRKMMGMSREKLGRMTCSEKTIQRIESGQVEPQMVTVREIFDKLGLCAEYKRARVVTSNAEAMRKSLDLVIKINTGNYEKAFQIHQELCTDIDMNVVFNEQEMKRAEAHILRGLGRISRTELTEILIDTIECTVAIDSFENKKEKHLSSSELSCVHNFLMYAEGKNVVMFRNYCENICTELLEIKEFENSCLTTYEMIMYQCANYVGDEGHYIKSRNISRKLLKESLRNRRMLYIVNCEYNELWTYQKLMELDKLSSDTNYIHKSLNRGLLLSDISRKEDWKLFFQQKLQNYRDEIKDA